MTIGLPGTGIGGLFYIAAALLAPLRSGPKRSALYVTSLAIAVLAGMFATGWLVGLMLGPAIRPSLHTAAQIAALPKFFQHSHVQNVLHVASVASTAVVLGAVLCLVQLIALVQNRWKR